MCNPDISVIRQAGGRMVDLLGLNGAPVGVQFMAAAGEIPTGAVRLPHHRYCQALMLARRGQPVVLDAQGISCPAAAAAFGFRPLPEGLRSGKGLVGFGIVSEASVGAAMLAGMPRLEAGAVAQLYLFPLDQALVVPDVIVVEDQVERLMWINLAYLNVTGGQRLQSSTAVLQATCVDATIIPHLEQRLNFSYGCYGCRDATDLEPAEAVLGFPTNLLWPVVGALAHLAIKAIPTSRAKKAWAALREPRAERGGRVMAAPEAEHPSQDSDFIQNRLPRSDARQPATFLTQAKS